MALMEKLIKLIKKLSGNIFVQSIVFLLAIAIILALVSNILSHWIGGLTSTILPYLQSEGLFAVLFAYFCYCVLQAVIIPLPASPVDIAIFTIVGPIITSIINIPATLIGYSISYLIARKYGRRALKRILPIKTYEKINQLSDNMNLKQFFWITIVPFNALDLMPYVGGLSKIRYRTVISILFLAVFYRISFTMLVVNKFWVR